MECQVEKKLHFRHLLLFHFNEKENASEAARNISIFFVRCQITYLAISLRVMQPFQPSLTNFLTKSQKLFTEMEFENYRNDGAKLLNKVETISLIDLLWNISLNKQ